MYHLVACFISVLLSVIGFVSAISHLGMAEEQVVAPTIGMSSNKTGPTFKQLVDGNRVHFHVGQSARPSVPSAPRTGVPYLLRNLFFSFFLFFFLCFPLYSRIIHWYFDVTMFFILLLFVFS